MKWYDKLLMLVVSILAGGAITALLSLIPTSANAADPIVTESTSTVTTNGAMTTKVESPPPSAIAPQLSTGSNSNLCVTPAGGAVQTQILGISIGSTFESEHCQMLLESKTLYDMGMRVAAVSRLCQTPKVWQAMMDAGTPCPINGAIGDEAKVEWEIRQAEQPRDETDEPTAEDKRNQVLSIMGAAAAAIFIF